MKKTILIGFDAACWDYLNPLLEAGNLPTLENLIKSGICGTLQTTMPPLTPVAWTSIATGKNPGKHGIFDMTQRRPGTYDFMPTSNQMRRGTPFWDRLIDSGVRVGLVNIPFTYPPEQKATFWVGGFGTPNSVFDVIYPLRLQNLIESKFGDHKPNVDPNILKSGSPAEIFEAEREHQTSFIKILGELINQQPVDVLVINLMLLDHANHKMPQMETVQQAIIETDRDLQKLIQEFQPDNTMVISDHGSRRVKGDFLLHAWLQDEGYCVQIERTAEERKDALNWILKQWLSSQNGQSGSLSKITRHLANFALTYLPRPLTKQIWGKIENTVPLAQKHLNYSEEVDYSRSQTFLGVSYSGVIYLNVVGRDVTGVIPVQEKDEITEEIIGKLSHVADPETNEPLFSNIYRAIDIFTGSLVENGPDIVIDGYNANWNILGTYKRGARAETMRYEYFVDNYRDFGHHSREGIFVFSGTDFKVSSGQQNGHVMDIPATLLHLYGVPIPEDYDGRVLVETINDEFMSQTPMSHQEGDHETALSENKFYSSEDEEELMSHLRALGYVE